MSISFEENMGPEAQSLIKKMFDVQAIDEKTALLGKMESMFYSKQMGDIARAAVLALHMRDNPKRRRVERIVSTQHEETT